ncbi:MAG TPA: hypothetical protein VLB51_03070 [Methylomirabilota bacterium]|nr:hypothetical protein [Methylomirabilota bacterium]
MAERGPGGGGELGRADLVRALRWPLVILVLAGLVAVAVRELRQSAREGGRAAVDAVRAAGEGAAEVAARFATGTITTSFTSALPRLVPDGGAKLELAAFEAVETLSRTDDRRVFFDLVPLGATVTEIRVPVTYRYHLRLDEPWRLAVTGQTCVVHAPPIRATLPPAIHTDRMEKRSESGWLRFDEDEQMAALERSLTPTLSDWAREPDRVDLVRELCRRRVADFVRSWLLLEDQWGPGRFTEVVVHFADEVPPPPAALPPEVVEGPRD